MLGKAGATAPAQQRGPVVMGPRVSRGRLVERVAPAHIGGVMPSRPTLTRAASNGKSYFLRGVKMINFSAGCIIELKTARNLTICVGCGTKIFFSPSLYLSGFVL